MTKTITYTITAPDEAPAMPEHFKLIEYEVYEDPKSHGRYKPGELSLARFKWVDFGYERCTLEAHAESETMPGGGSFEIYSQWNESKREWGGWLDNGDGKPFDFADVQAALEAKVCARCRHLEDDHGPDGVCTALRCKCLSVFVEGESANAETSARP